MHILSIFLAALAIIFGVRLLLTAVQTALSGKVLIRRGWRTSWQAATTRNDAWKAALRDGVMGVLLVVLGVVLLL